jgi:RNA polymerase sigma factor (sigma-70 family)
MSMLDAKQELAHLMQLLREGSEDAARELWERYGEHVLRVVRRKLDRKLRAKYDSADLAQAVWLSFFVEPHHDYRFERPEDLLAFLADLAQHKLVDVQRQRYRTKKHNVNREHSLEGSAATEAAAMPDRRASPVHTAIARERWERLLDGQPEHHRHILEMLQQGYTHEEIARELGISAKTVQRLLRKMDSRSMP